MLLYILVLLPVADPPVFFIIPYYFVVVYFCCLASLASGNLLRKVIRNISTAPPTEIASLNPFECLIYNGKFPSSRPWVCVCIRTNA